MLITTETRQDVIICVFDHDYYFIAIQLIEVWSGAGSSRTPDKRSLLSPRVCWSLVDRKFSKENGGHQSLPPTQMCHMLSPWKANKTIGQASSGEVTPISSFFPYFLVLLCVIFNESLHFTGNSFGDCLFTWSFFWLVSASTLSLFQRFSLRREIIFQWGPDIWNEQQHHVRKLVKSFKIHPSIKKRRHSMWNRLLLHKFLFYLFSYEIIEQLIPSFL